MWILQGCALRETEGSPALLICKIKDAQRVLYNKSKTF